MLKKYRNYLNRIIKTGNIKSPAFTLVEIIVILFIISVGLIGVLSLVIQNIQSQMINKNNIIAYQLAQEGVELVRKVRDTNWANSVDWREGLADGPYFMDHLDSLPQVLSSDDKADLYKDASGNYYHEGTSGQTNFTRNIIITTIDENTMSVITNVKWMDRSHSLNYELEARLYDWY